MNEKQKDPLHKLDEKDAERIWEEMEDIDDPETLLEAHKITLQTFTNPPPLSNIPTKGPKIGKEKSSNHKDMALGAITPAPLDDDAYLELCKKKNEFCRMVGCTKEDMAKCDLCNCDPWECSPEEWDEFWNAYSRIREKEE